MRRRDFLAAAGGAWLASPLLAGRIPPDLRITRIVGFDLATRRWKVAGKNSRLDVHGDRSRDRMVRIFTNAGVEGLGSCRASQQVLGKLLGRNPFAAYDEGQPRMGGPLASQTTPLWDLAGRLLGKPVHQLLGERGPRRVPVYDGSIYFADLLPQYASRWQDRFKEEVDVALEAGHRALKIKIGRGHRWMPRAEGDERDVDVVRVIRGHTGPEIALGVDANNGYDLAGAERFLDRAGDLEIAFVEEMFPEQVEHCLELKRFMAGRGWQTLLADGETQADLAAFQPLIAAQAIDVLQGDMNRFGFDGILSEARQARPRGILIAPHNWGSLMGFYMQLHVGRAIDNFYRAEHDPLTSNLLLAEGYRIQDGTCHVPDRPGLGLRINEPLFRDVKIRFDLKAS